MNTELTEVAQKMKTELARVIVGQEEVIEELLIAVFSGGHVLLEGVPGVAKTLLARSLAATLGVGFRRIQFTPDLMPADIIGTNVFNPAKRSFQFSPGPIFTQLLFADEINRTPPKTQSALLEAMQERQVTVDGKEHPLPEFFFVIATQNPIEYEGTYPLPEAQSDRFMMKIFIDYPGMSEEKDILKRYHEGRDLMDLEAMNLQVVIAPERIRAAREQLAGVRVEEGLFDYIIKLIQESRQSPWLSLGASPRAAVHLLLAGKAAAGLRGREFVIPDDIKSAMRPVLRHRLVLKPEAELEGRTPDGVIAELASSIPIPR